MGTGKSSHLRFGYNEPQGLAVIFHLVFRKQDLAKHLRIALLWNVIWAFRNKTKLARSAQLATMGHHQNVVHLYNFFNSKQTRTNDAGREKVQLEEEEEEMKHAVQKRHVRQTSATVL